MAKKQKRRTVSVSGPVYEKYRAMCEGRQVAMAAEVQAFMEREIARFEREVVPWGGNLPDGF